MATPTPRHAGRQRAREAERASGLVAGPSFGTEQDERRAAREGLDAALERLGHTRDEDRVAHAFEAHHGGEAALPRRVVG